MKECDEIIRPALESALSESAFISEDNRQCRVTLPFDRADGDKVTLWVISKGDKYRITDHGETYGMLFLSNINLNQARRSQRLDAIMQQYELDRGKREVSLHTDRENLGSRLIDAVQAVQAISYLAWTRQKYTRSDFRDDVGEFMVNEGYYFTRNSDVVGQSESHIVDFSVHNTDQPTYIDTVHAENASSARNIAERIGFAWTDIERQNPDVVTISVLDDEAGEYDVRTENILRDYSDAFVPWSQRSELIEVLG